MPTQTTAKNSTLKILASHVGWGEGRAPTCCRQLSLKFLRHPKLPAIVKTFFPNKLVENTIKVVTRGCLRRVKLARLSLTDAGLKQKLKQIWLGKYLIKTGRSDKVGCFKFGQFAQQMIWLTLLSISPAALAASVGEVAQNAAGSLDKLGSAAQVFFGLCGLILIGVSIFTFIKYNKTEGHGVKLSTAFVYLIGGGLLFYVASLIQTTGDTVWGNGGGDRTHIKIQRSNI